MTMTAPVRREGSPREVRTTFPLTQKFEARISHNLTRLGFEQPAIAKTLGHLRLVEELEKTIAFHNYAERLLSPSRQQAAGALGELRAVSELRHTADILDLCLDCGVPGSRDRIEFFDIIARDRRSGKLLLIEVKRDWEYGLGDLGHQLLGIGNEWTGQARKALCQLDVILDPNRYALPLKYHQEIMAGNFEVRLMINRGIGDFANFYGKARNLQFITDLLLARAESNTLFTDSRVNVQIKEETISLIKRIAGQLAERGLAGVAMMTTS
jgi:hypothetical protein